MTIGESSARRHQLDDEAQRDLRIDVTAVLARLPERLRHLCARLTTENISTIAAEDGRSRWHVYQDLVRIRAAFLAAGLTTTD